MTTPARFNLSLLARLALLVAVAAICVRPQPAAAQLLLDEMPGAENVGVDDTRGTELPLDAVIHDADGKPHRLESFFDGERPVILVMAYYSCPVLCSMVHANLRSALNDINLTLGEDYRVVTISFDPKDDAAAAREHEDRYHNGLRDEPGDDGWMFCTTTDANAQRIADAVGFRYQYVPDTGEYAHVAAVFFIDANGTVHNFMENAQYRSRDVKMALIEAAEGRVGSMFDRVLMTCFLYNPETGKYTVVWMGVMRIVGTLCVLGLGSLIGGMLWSSARRRRLESGEESESLPSETDGFTESERIKS